MFLGHVNVALYIAKPLIHGLAERNSRVWQKCDFIIMRDRSLIKFPTRAASMIMSIYIMYIDIK